MDDLARAYLIMDKQNTTAIKVTNEGCLFIRVNRLTLRWIPLENFFSFLQAKCTELEAHSAVLEDERARVESEGKAKGEEHLKVIQSLQTELEHTANNPQLLTDAKMQLEVVCLCMHACTLYLPVDIDVYSYIHTCIIYILMSYTSVIIVHISICILYACIYRYLDILVHVLFNTE